MPEDSASLGLETEMLSQNAVEFDCVHNLMKTEYPLYTLSNVERSIITSTKRLKSKS